MLHNLTKVQPQTQHANHQLLHLDTSLDLSDLSADQALRLKLSVNEFRSAGRRMVGELYIMTSQLSVMKEILGDRFRSFAETTLGLTSRALSRYMHINNVLNTHFAVNGQVDLAIANNLTQRALALLTPETEAAVVDNLRELAQQGTQINEKLVMEVMSRAEGDAVAQLASTQADLTARTRELEQERQSREVERARSQREISSQGELLRRGEQRIRDLEADLQRLAMQETQVHYQDREVIPEGFASVQAAVDAKNSELAGLNKQREEIKNTIERLNQQQLQLQSDLEQRNAGIEKFLAMKEQAETIIAQFPIALLKSLSETDPAVKAAISSLGQTMNLLGQQLAKASA